jgi:uncharacterized iron-regulated membrane protein
MTLKKVFGKIHLWLGLLSGLIVFIVSISGCFLVFEKEISGLFGYGVFQKVERKELPFAPPSAIFAVADSVLADKAIRQMYYTVFLNEPNVTILWARDTSRQYHAVLQNPYTAEIAGTYNYKTSFFAFMTIIHTSLALGEVGTTLVKYATLIFVVMMVTGIVLWKPASRKGYKQRFAIKWNAKGKRLNYDLHNVFGFYMTWIAIFIALTGLVWSFEWVNGSVQWMANGGKTIVTKKEKLFSDTTNLFSPKNEKYKIADSVFEHVLVKNNGINAITIYKPVTSSDVIRLNVETINGASYTRSDEYNFDQYSGRLLAVHKFDDLSNGEKLRHMNYYIHVGSIGGLTGKFLAFFASLIAASLPITGFIIWRGRRRKKSQEKNPNTLPKRGINL